ncbi:MAG TPA: hypothetical protein VLA96_03040 [Terriglobales bacterium]|nr:hypothetical protein [Terriglobales bacterium]
MSQSAYTKLAAFIFALQAAAQLARSVLQTPAAIGNFQIPVWFSYVAVVFLGVLSWLGFRAARS